MGLYDRASGNHCPACGYVQRISKRQTVSGGASAPASRVLVEEQGLEPSQPSETEHICECGRVAASAAGLAVHKRSHPEVVQA